MLLEEILPLLDFKLIKAALFIITGRRPAFAAEITRNFLYLIPSQGQMFSCLFKALTFTLKLPLE